MTEAAHPTTAPRDFHVRARDAISDRDLQATLDKFTDGFPLRRKHAVARLPEFDALRDAARDIKNHVLANLDTYLERFEARVTEAGGTVHWCRDAAEARATVLDICRGADAKSVTKSKSMVGEEIGINEHLDVNGIVPVETDLGEYIIQLREEPPSHIIAPAIHLSIEQVADTFRAHHTHLPPERPLVEPRTLLEEARAELRRRFGEADVGLTGANMLVAETGSIVLVTNEGNADLTYCLPRVHIALATIEKAVPTLEDAATILRVLARSATGQEMSVYSSVVTGPKRAEDADGPDEFHVILLDNGRTELLASEFHEILRCIKCGACIDHCPVYGSIGGHAYGAIYPGPMGSVLTPALTDMASAYDLPNASTLCGRCESVCPMRIPLPKLLRRWRERQFEAGLGATRQRWALRTWAWLARRPQLYRFAVVPAVRVLSAMGRGGRFRRLPFAGGWTDARDLPAPEGETFLTAWKRRGGAI